MSRPCFWVGLDVGADEMAVCETDDQGHVIFEHLVPTQAAALHALLKSHKRRIRLIGLEAGSFGMTLARSLRKLGYVVAVFEARQASRFLAIRQNKTDKNDARGLADIARLGRDSVSEVRVKTVECQRLRSTLVTRHKLVQLRIAVEGSMRSLFRLNGGKLKSAYSVATLRRNASEEIGRLRQSAKIDLSEDIEPLLALSTAARTYVEALDKKLLRKASDDPVCRRFLEIPGVGPITALCFYSAVEDPNRFRRSADVGAFLGLVPVVRQSGSTTAKLRISKRGDSMTRTCLTTAAQQHLRHSNSSLTAWGAVLAGRLRKRGVQVAVARKLAVTMLAMWRSGERYDPFRDTSGANLAATPEPLIAM
jgi:transposase